MVTPRRYGRRWRGASGETRAAAAASPCAASPQIEVFDFLADPDDRAYREWWPGTHLHFHLLGGHPGHVGDRIYMDEDVGERRVRMTGVVRKAIPGKKLA